MLNRPGRRIGIVLATGGPVVVALVIQAVRHGDGTIWLYGVAAAALALAAFTAVAGMRTAVAAAASVSAERRLREVVEGVNVVVWEADAQTLRCSYVSPQAEAMFGHPLELWRSGEIWRLLIHPEDVEQVLAECEAATQRGDHELVYRVVRADGSMAWVRNTVRVVFDEDGSPARLRGVLTDVTQEIQATEALRQSEERFHSLYDRMPIGLYRTTPDGCLIDANPALVRLLGYETREQLLSSNAVDVYLGPEERAHWQRILAATDEVIVVDRQHRLHDGTLVWLRDTARAMRDDTGATICYEGALQDITERVSADEALRRSEARFRSMIENASDGVLILSRDGRIRYQSPAVERILGYSPEQTAGRSPFDLVHPDDIDEVRQSFANVMSPEGHGKSIEFRCRHRDGTWRTLHVLGTNLLEDPAVGGVVINMIDVTVHRSLEHQVQHAQRLEAVGRLAGGIAHDFNNLLTAIRGYTDLLSDQLAVDGRSNADLNEIRRAIDRAAGLTRQLLTFSRRQIVRPRATALDRIVADLEPMLGRLADGIPLRVQLEPDAWVHADPGQLEQVVVNLVVNARDALPARIDIAVEAVDIDGAADAPGPGRWIRLTVTDDGVGITPDVLPHIFEPFFTTKDVGGGTGLGLATVYGIVRDAGGSIDVDSQPHAGTHMRLYFPRVSASIEVAPDPLEVAAEPDGGSELIVVVEDEPAVRSLAERVLMRHGYQVITASNGVEALNIVSSRLANVDLLITDVVMPEMGGVQLARELTARRPDLLVMFMSGYAADALPHFDRAGQVHFLPKPFSPASFAETVRRVLDDAPRHAA